MQPNQQQNQNSPLPAWVQPYIASNCQSPMLVAYQQMCQMFVLMESNRNALSVEIELLQGQQEKLIKENKELVTEVNNLRQRLAACNNEDLFVKQNACGVTPFDASRVRRVDPTPPTFNGYGMPVEQCYQFQELLYSLDVKSLEYNWVYHNGVRLKQSNEALGEEIGNLRRALRVKNPREAETQDESRIGRWSPTAFGTPRSPNGASPQQLKFSAERPRHV